MHMHATMIVSSGKNKSLVSFDVTSLLTNVPIEEAVGVIWDKLRKDEDLVENTTLTR